MFDQNMLNELAKLKVDRKRRRNEEDDVDYEGYSEPDREQQDDSDNEQYEEIPNEIYEEVDIDHVEDSPSLNNLSEFIGETISDKSLAPEKYIAETFAENDYSTDEGDKDAEARAILIAGRKATKDFVDKDGQKVKSRYMDETGSLNVVYGEPGKNVVNRKSIQEQRLDVKMEALSGLLTKFKSEDEIKAEENEKDVILMDKTQVKKDLKSMEQVLNIKHDLDLKISMVVNTFKTLSKEIETMAKLPDINLNITSADYLRALFLKKGIDDMDVSRIFTLSLFLESPENFPTNDTFEQVQYRNSQVGAKSKSIDLKRLITYLSSDSEFNTTVELVSGIIKHPHLDLSGIRELFDFKCAETLKTLMLRYLKSDTTDFTQRVNVLNIRKEVQFKYRNIESTLNFLESLKAKLKVLPSALKDQIKKTTEQITAAEEKIIGLQQERKKLETELTLLIVLFIARQANGYSINFVNNMPVEEIEKQLLDFSVNTESEFVRGILANGIKEETFNEILKSR